MKKVFFPALILVVALLCGITNVPHVYAATLLENASIIDGGISHTVVLKEDGTVRTWGYNAYGQLGDGTTITRQVRTEVPGLTNVVAVTASSNFTVVLKDDGTVWAWGQNNCGQLGDGTTTTRKTPVQVKGLTNVKQIVAGLNYVIALKDDGTIWAWGKNGYGQLGDGTTITRKTPVEVTNLTNVKNIAAGATHTIALKEDGTVWTWGYNYYGQLGDGTITNSSTPIQVTNLTDIKDIAAGTNYTVALKEDGTVWSWGQNSYGKLGDGTTIARNTPVKVTNLTNVKDIATGANYTIALKEDGTVWAWGQNSYGQLGDGTITVRKTPIQVKNIENVCYIGAGNNHTILAKEDGTIWTSGYNKYGQLGDGTITTAKNFVQVVGLSIGQPDYDTGIVIDDVITDSSDVVDDGTTDSSDVVDGGTTDSGDGSSAQVTNEDLVTTAESAVSAIEKLASADLSTPEAINEAQQSYEESKALVDALPEGTAKDELLADLELVEKEITDAQNILNAESKVLDVEKLASTDLSTQEAITGAQQSYEQSKALVDALPEGTAKNELLARLDLVEKEITDAQNILNAESKVLDVEKLASTDLSTQEAINEAQQSYEQSKALVDALPEGTAKDDLLSELKLIDQKILEAQAILNVEIVEKSFLQTDLNNALQYVNMLPDGQLKEVLLARLNEVQKVINVMDILKGILNSDLNTYEAIDKAITKLNMAEGIISTVENKEQKQNLINMFQIAKIKITDSLIALLSDKSKGKAQQLSDLSLEFLVKVAIEKVGAVSITDRGKVMGYIMPIVNNHSTGYKVNVIIDKYLK